MWPFKTCLLAPLLHVCVLQLQVTTHAACEVLKGFALYGLLAELSSSVKMNCLPSLQGLWRPYLTFESTTPLAMWITICTAYQKWRHCGCGVNIAISKWVVCTTLTGWIQQQAYVQNILPSRRETEQK
jgi:hypothetical protein